MNAVVQVREQNIDFLLAVGGRSVIDGTKFVAAAAVFEGDEWDILLEGGRNIKSALLFGSVLTLPATGCERNKGGVVTGRALEAKLRFESELEFTHFLSIDR